MNQIRKERHWRRQRLKFEEWFNNTDLGHLEDVRAYVEMHAWDNAADVPLLQKARIAIATVKSYLDDEALANESFNPYRR